VRGVVQPMRLLAGIPSVASAFLCLLTTASGAPTDFSYVIDQVKGTPGRQVVLETKLVSAIGGIQGWSVGQCFVNTQVAKAISATIQGTPTATIKAGEPPAFQRINVLPNGITQGVVIDFDGVVKAGPFSPDAPLVIFRATYQILAEAQEGSCLQIQPCATLGDPPVIPVVVIAGESISVQGPYNQDGEVCAVLPTGNRLYFEEDRYPLAEGATEVRVKVLMDTGNAITGFSFGVSHNPDLLTLRGIEQGSNLAATNGGKGPTFFETDISPNPGPGGTVGCLISMARPFDSLGPGEAFHLVDLVYNVAAGATAGMVSNLSFTSALDTPKVDVVFDASGTAYTPEDGTLEVVTSRVIYGGGAGGPKFLRGDVTDDGKLTISDGVRIARDLFQQGPAISCDDAADANDDEKLDAADVLYLLNHLFLGGPGLPAPSAACGPDDTGAGDLGCVSHTFCEA